VKGKDHAVADGALQRREKDMDEAQTWMIDDDVWDRLVELTGGAANLCFQCGVCTAACPWGRVREPDPSVRTLIREAQLGLQDGSEALWLCTSCAQCMAYCPRGVDVIEVFRSLRLLAWEARRVEEGLPSLLWSVYWNNNPWTQPPSHRSSWAQKLDLPPFDPAEHEVLFYVGCTSSYDRRAQKIASSLVKLLQSTGVTFGYLGDEEPCCGEAVLSVGHQPYFQEVAAQTAQVFQEKGVTQLVIISPHCYDVFKNHYPQLGGAFQPIHYTQFLAQLLDQGRLKFNSSLDQPIAYHDPCYLGRHNGEYDAPRRVLQSIPGVTLIEMESSGVEALCCGGGGGRMWLETPVGERFSDLRVTEASQTGAAILATACPFCVICLEDSAKGLQIEGLKVMDVAEVASLSIAMPN
jgi:Fe-S oxidoreductase